VVPTAALPDSPAGAQLAPALTEVLSVSAEELESTQVCEFRTLAGSRIAYRHCYSREDHAANQAARDERTEERVELMRRMQANAERQERERWEAQERALMYQAGQN
jgi:hypothetical protein